MEIWYIINYLLMNYKVFEYMYVIVLFFILTTSILEIKNLSVIQMKHYERFIK